MYEEKGTYDEDEPIEYFAPLPTESIPHFPLELVLS